MNVLEKILEETSNIYRVVESNEDLRMEQGSEQVPEYYPWLHGRYPGYRKTGERYP